MKNINNPIGNCTRDLSACSAGPQPTAPPRTPHILLGSSSEGLHFVVETKFGGVAPRVCESGIWNFMLLFGRLEYRAGF
jgi:hypothetical protein